MFRSFALGLAAITLTASAPPSDPAEREARQARDDIARFAHHALAEMGASPAMGIAVMQGGETVYADAFGIADVQTGRAANADTRFYIASSTKSFTALAIASLARRGVVDLDAPIADWAPDSGMPPALAAQVTLRDLLSHRSGIDNAGISFRAAISGEHTSALMHALLAETISRSKYPHGTFRYSNANYNIATTLIEAKTGLAWQTLVDREVLQPLGMKATTGYVSKAKGMAAGHLSLEPGTPERSYLQKQDSTMQSAGGLATTAGDLALWLKAQLGDGVVDGRRVFPAGLIASTHRPMVETGGSFDGYKRISYGLGWHIGSSHGAPFVHHFGGFAGWRTHISFMPKANAGVVVMLNEDAVGASLADLVADYCYDRLARVAGIEAVYRDRLAALVAERDKARAGIAAQVRQRSEREWTLTRPVAAYVGTYRNLDFGTVRITEEEGKPVFDMGVLHAVAEPFTRPDTIRIEPVPLQGQLLEFQVDGGGRVTGLRFLGSDFARDGAVPTRP